MGLGRVWPGPPDSPLSTLYYSYGVAAFAETPKTEVGQHRFTFLSHGSLSWRESEEDGWVWGPGSFHVVALHPSRVSSLDMQRGWPPTTGSSGRERSSREHTTSL